MCSFTGPLNVFEVSGLDARGDYTVFINGYSTAKFYYYGHAVFFAKALYNDEIEKTKDSKFKVFSAFKQYLK